MPSRVRLVALLGCASLLAGCMADPVPPVSQAASALSQAEPGRAAFYVVVERGQTLDQIAQIYRVPKKAIVAANHLSVSRVVKPGMMLEVPVHLAKARSGTGITTLAEAGPKRVRVAKSRGHAATIKRVAAARPRGPGRTRTVDKTRRATPPASATRLSAATPPGQRGL
jgi:LysM repeat protein